MIEKGPVAWLRGGTKREREGASSPASDPGGLPAGTIESLGGDAVAQRLPIIVGGWALSAEGPIVEGLVLVDGKHGTAVDLGFPREDVAAKFPGVPDSSQSGWSAMVDLRGVEGDVAELTLLGRTRAGAWVELSRAEMSVEEPGSRATRTGAVFTIVQNETRFLPLWLKHYSRHFDRSDIYVLDHDSTDGSTDGLEDHCNVVKVHRDKSFDHMWLKGTVQDFMAFLLRSYSAVLFTDVDEMIAPDPDRYPDLPTYMARTEGPAACCTGYNVVHYPEEEPALDFNQPVLRQREYWHPSPQYSKRLLGRVPLAWNVGLHQEFNVPSAAPDPDLLLIHLHRVDYESCLERHRSNASRDWPEDDLAFNLSWHQRVVEGDEFDDWFYRGDDLEGNARVPIPERFRDLV